MADNNNPVPILIGAMTAFSWHLFNGSDIAATAVYALLLTAGVIYSSRINGKKPFVAAGHITFGVLIGTILDIVLFPTVNGFERNLGPIEIVMATVLALVFTSLIGVFVYLYFRLVK